jgi:hypothetical protein
LESSNLAGVPITGKRTGIPENKDHLSMSTQPTIAEILPRIERAIQRVNQAVKTMPPDQIDAPLLAGGRSVKDVLGHLTWWDQWLLVTLPPAPGDPPLDITLPLSDQIPPTNDWADDMNAKVLAYNQPRQFPEIWTDFSTTVDLLVRRVSQLTDEDLYDPNGMAAIIGQPVAPNILGIYEHYEEHAHELERILTGS